MSQFADSSRSSDTAETQYPTISIVLPAYNEEGIIGEMLQTTSEYGDDYLDEYEIIVIDDGSEDTTRATADEFASGDRNVTVHSHADNRGKGAAFNTGVEHARNELTLLLDADLELDPTLIHEYIQIIERTEADVVIGSKTHPRSEVVYSRWRTFLSKAYAALVRRLFDLDIGDPQTGMKLFHTETLEDIVESSTIQYYAFDIELLVLAQMEGCEIVEAPVNLDYSGNSSVGLGTIFTMGADTLKIFLRH